MFMISQMHASEDYDGIGRGFYRGWSAFWGCIANDMECWREAFNGCSNTCLCHGIGGVRVDKYFSVWVFLRDALDPQLRLSVAC